MKNRPCGKADTGQRDALKLIEGNPPELPAPLEPLVGDNDNRPKNHRDRSFRLEDCRRADPAPTAEFTDEF
ncbi:MAG: hypothetical protein LBS62_01230 [Clostridiales bacterium]|nr:hypothetical protein [Clostridiales bacterium]